MSHGGTGRPRLTETDASAAEALVSIRPAWTGMPRAADLPAGKRSPRADRMQRFAGVDGDTRQRGRRPWPP